jgi:hypothetical protein
MTTVQDLEMTTEERYTSAIPASSLKFEAHKQGSADVIAAAGMSRSRVGAALMRLHTEWDRAEKPRRIDSAGLQRIAAELCDDEGRPDHARAEIEAAKWHHQQCIFALMRLKTLREVRVELTAQMVRWKIVDPADKAPAVILWWLDQTCPNCHGTKLAATGRGSICKTCRGTGQARIPMGEEGKRLANYIDDCVDVARNSIKNRLRNTIRR